MNRKKMTMFSVAAAILLAAGLAGGIWISYYSGRGTGFELPLPLPPGSSLAGPVTGPSAGGLGFIPVNVDAGNVQKLLNAVERPEMYSQTIRCTAYWQGGQEDTVHTWARRGGFTRVETRREGFPPENRLITPERVYIWTGDELPYYDLTPEEPDAESLTGIPTWEDAASLPPDKIIRAEYFTPDGARCLRVVTRRPVYTVAYIISLDTGLLISAEYTDDSGETAFLCLADPPFLGDPGDGRFTLPDGVTP